MDPVWTQQQGSWGLQCPLDGGKKPQAFEWRDNYVSFEASCPIDIFTYKVTLLKEKEHDVLLDEKWLLVIVGRMKKMREHLQGVKLYRDSKVIFAKMGNLPTYYFLMLRERHGQVG